MKTSKERLGRGPCFGYRVIDFSTVISGPFCSQILGDLGADVVKVETPRGDVSRFLGPRNEEGISGMFAQFNRNKRSIVLDLKKPDSKAVVASLCKDVDVVVHNFRPGVAERLGIGEADLRAQSPGLIYVSISGFGNDGPYASYPAYDMTIQGLSGMMPIQGEGQGAPRMIQSFFADKCTATTAASAAVAALLARERDGGVGQRVDVPMLDAYAAFALPDLIVADTFQPPDPAGPAKPPEIFRTWETADGYVVGIVLEDRQFVGICRALGRTDLLEDERYASVPGRMKHAGSLFELLENEFRRHTTNEIVSSAQEHGAPFAAVNDLAGFFRDPQVQHNRVVEDVANEGVRKLRLLRHPARYSMTPAVLRRYPPRLGQHTDEILADVGCGVAQREAWKSSGVIA